MIKYRPMDPLKELRSRYKKAALKVAHEDALIKRARDRKYYWQSQAKLIKDRIKIVVEGQIKFPF